MGIKRTKLADKARANCEKIKKLEEDNIQLLIKSWLLCDEKQQYKEEQETHGRGKNKKTQLIGRIHWKQMYNCGEGEKQIEIERSRVVRIDGEWQVN